MLRFSFRIMGILLALAIFNGSDNIVLAQSVIAQQDFDGSTPKWDYHSNVPFFDNTWGSDGRYDDVPSSAWSGNLNFSSLSGKVLGINDLDDEGNNGTENTAKVTFEERNVSGYQNVKITFDYDFESFDKFEYEVFEDGSGQGLQTLVNGNTKQGNQSISISSNTQKVKLVFRIKQNSASEYGGIDNIQLKGNQKSQSEPANQPNNFKASPENNSQIELTWTDASAGPQAPDGYLIKAKNANTISAPSDGSDPVIDDDLSDGSGTVKVGHGSGGSYAFTGLNRDTEYHFQIWSFTNAEGNIDYLNSNSSPASNGPTAKDTTHEDKDFYTESFETGSGFSYPNGNGHSGEDIFDRTDLIGYDATADFIYSGLDQSYYIAGEDINGTLSTSEGQVKITDVDISDYRDLKIKGDFASGSNSGIENSDFISVEIKIDNGSWKEVGRFEGNGNNRFGEDTDLDGTADGTELDGEFEEFVWSFSGNGNDLDIRIKMDMNGGDEEAAFDNIRVAGESLKRWDDGASGNSDWSSADNWNPKGVPNRNDSVIFDDTHLSGDYTVTIDQNLNQKKVLSMDIVPGSNQSITVKRASGLNSFQLTGGNDKNLLVIEGNATYIDKNKEGLAENFDQGNGNILVKADGTYKVNNQSSGQFSTASLVDALASASSTKGEVVIQSVQQTLSASGKTYPTQLTLKRNTNASNNPIQYKTGGSNDFTIKGDFTVGDDVTFKGKSGRSGNLVIKGDLALKNNSDINLNTGSQELVLKGSSQQSLTGLSQIATFTVDNSNGVDLDESLTVNDQLNLTNGVLNLTNSSDVLTIEDDVTVSPSGGKSTSYVDGTVKKKGDDQFTFPIGDGNKWAKLEISAPSNTTDAFKAGYNNSGYTNTSSMAPQSNNPNNNPQLNNVSDVEYWTLDNTNGSPTVDVTLHWEDGSSSGSNITNLSKLKVAHWNSSNSEWENYGKSSTSGSKSGSGSITLNNVSNFSPFTFGSTSSNSNPLPVEMLYFRAEKQNERVRLDWATAAETRNDHFLVQRKQAHGEWKNIGKVEGYGNATTRHEYQFYDGNPCQVNYYRLKQVDFDGTFDFSSVKAVKVSPNEDQFKVVAPFGENPYIESDVAKKQAVQIRVLNLEGDLLEQKEKNVYPGSGRVKIPAWDQLAGGTYLLRILNDHSVHTKKLIKH